jgi:hypothetical protein
MTRDYESHDLVNDMLTYIELRDDSPLNAPLCISVIALDVISLNNLKQCNVCMHTESFDPIRRENESSLDRVIISSMPDTYIYDHMHTRCI